MSWARKQRMYIPCELISSALMNCGMAALWRPSWKWRKASEKRLAARNSWKKSLCSWQYCTYASASGGQVHFSRKRVAAFCRATVSSLKQLLSLEQRHDHDHPDNFVAQFRELRAVDPSPSPTKTHHKVQQHGTLLGPSNRMRRISIWIWKCSG